ncbi:uncharacterized protein LOC110266433 [Arachis ipaensis]|uniref:uncharacterized protein LOC110266433 n=1 Tax=Arachis ipaensis TaxID=130454 RepID=UPI000A2B658A|nr:uncharacterized protein LOC110266433 [Arachis ipaensis]
MHGRSRARAGEKPPLPSHLAAAAAAEVSIVVLTASQSHRHPWLSRGEIPQRERERGCSRFVAAVGRMAALADLPTAVYACCCITGAPRRHCCHQKPPLKPTSAWLYSHREFLCCTLPSEPPSRCCRLCFEPLLQRVLLSLRLLGLVVPL